MIISAEDNTHLAAATDDYHVNLKKIKDLFNIGKLTVNDARWCLQQGYDVICGNGRVDCVKIAEENNYL